MEALALAAFRGARGLYTMAGPAAITGTAGVGNPDPRPVVRVAAVVVVAMVAA